MSYDIYFYRPRPGVKLSAIVETDFEDRDGLVEAISDEELRALAKSLIAVLPGFEVVEEDDAFEIAPADEDAPVFIEVLLMPDECSIGFPYGQEAKPVFALVQKAARVLSDFGLQVHDPQLDGDFDAHRAAASYSKISRDVLGRGG